MTRVFVRFQRSLLRYLRDLLARREDAEDVAQETYVRLVRARLPRAVRAAHPRVHVQGRDESRLRPLPAAALARPAGRRASSRSCRTKRRPRNASSRWSRPCDRRAHVARVAAALPASVPAADVARAQLRGDRGAARHQQAHRRARDANGARRVPTRVTRRRAAMTSKECDERRSAADEAAAGSCASMRASPAPMPRSRAGSTNGPRTSARLQRVELAVGARQAARGRSGQRAARRGRGGRAPASAQAHGRAFVGMGRRVGGLVARGDVRSCAMPRRPRPRPRPSRSKRRASSRSMRRAVPVAVLPSGAVVDASAVAVLPFAAAGDATLAEGLERDVVAALRTVPGLYVIADDAVQPYAATDLAAAEIGGQLGARGIVEAAVELVDGRVLVSARLRDSATGATFGAPTSIGPSTSCARFATRSPRTSPRRCSTRACASRSCTRTARARLSRQQTVQQ